MVHARAHESRERAPVVLIVEDEKEFRRSLARALAKERYEVLTAGDAEEAIRLLSSTRCDLIVSDLTMPGLSGSQLVDALRRVSGGASVIVISARGAASGAASLRGVAAYLVKPLRRQVLLDAVASVLAEAGRRPS
jgi:DNA-binding response OmpR family regulator